MVTSDHLGSLYQTFPWSGPIRDPYRSTVEIMDPASYLAMSASDLVTLTTTLQQRDIIMQIGGMGSAKLNADGALVNTQFKTYMDAIVADKGLAWRNVVTARASEVALATPDTSRLYWQIGNEINASSYLQNINLYLGQSNSSLLDIIPVYVEYFLAPTAQAMRQAATDTSKPVRLALGSIAGFSNANSQTFLDTLLNYTVVGTYAPALAGMKVSALVELLTIHYLMNAGTPEQPEAWRDVLVNTRQKWLGVGAITGVWSTEEVGVRAASDGKGGGGALRIQSRYLGWVSDKQDAPRTTRWFYYGTQDGPKGQQITDALTQWHQLTGNHPLKLHDRQHTQNGTLESYAFRVDGAAGWLITVTALGNGGVAVTDVPITLAGVNTGTAKVRGWLYAAGGTSTVNASLVPTSGGVQVRLSGTTTLVMPDSLLLWISD